MEEESAAAATTRALQGKGSDMASLPPEAAWRKDPQARTSTAQPLESVSDPPKAKAIKSEKPSRAVTCARPRRAGSAGRSQAAWTACAFPRMSRDPRQPERRCAGATLTLECARKPIWKGMVDPMSRDKHVDRGNLVLQARVRGRPRTRAWMQVRRYPGIRLEPDGQSTNPGSLLDQITSTSFCLTFASFK